MNIINKTLYALKETITSEDRDNQSTQQSEDAQVKILICYKLILNNYNGLGVITSPPSYVYYQAERLSGTYGFPPNNQLGGSGGTYEFLLY